MHLTCCTAGDGEVLAGKMYQAAIDRRASRDHSIRRQFFIGHTEVSGTVFREKAYLLEASSVDELFHTLACGKLARYVLLLDPLFAAALLDCRSLVVKFSKLVLYRPFLLRNQLQFGGGDWICGHSRPFFVLNAHGTFLKIPEKLPHDQTDDAVQGQSCSGRHVDSQRNSR